MNYPYIQAQRHFQLLMLFKKLICYNFFIFYLCNLRNRSTERSRRSLRFLLLCDYCSFVVNSFISRLRKKFRTIRIATMAPSLSISRHVGLKIVVTISFPMNTFVTNKKGLRLSTLSQRTQNSIFLCRLIILKEMPEKGVEPLPPVTGTRF